jgi:excisionase family DNA binding protein
MEATAIPIARASLQRIRELWRLLFGRSGFSLRYDGYDEVIYQNLRSALLAQLNRRSDYADTRLTALGMLPEALPADKERELFDDDIRQSYESGFQQLDALLIKLALAEDVNPDPNQVRALFVTHDDHLRQLSALVTKDSNATQRVFHPPPSGTVEQPTKPRRSQGTGRRRVPLTYELAQRAWWDMSDDTLSSPSQPEFCDRLAGLGFPMSPRTLRVRIQEWRDQGLDWPPPRPEFES